MFMSQFKIVINKNSRVKSFHYPWNSLQIGCRCYCIVLNKYICSLYLLGFKKSLVKSDELSYLNLSILSRWRLCGASFLNLCPWSDWLLSAENTNKTFNRVLCSSICRRITMTISYRPIDWNATSLNSGLFAAQWSAYWQLASGVWQAAAGWVLNAERRESWPHDGTR